MYVLDVVKKLFDSDICGHVTNFEALDFCKVISSARARVGSPLEVHGARYAA